MLQLVLTLSAPALRSPAAFGAWIPVCAASLGVGMPTTFALAVDLVPVEDRGAVAAATTAVAYFLANVYPTQWQVESFILLMFGVYFIDSLGFLRIIETPAYIYTSWQSLDFGVHLLIGGVHVLTAAMGGILYANFDRRWLFALVFGLFGFTHLMYVFDVGAGVGDAPLLMPLFYTLY